MKLGQGPVVTPVEGHGFSRWNSHLAAELRRIRPWLLRSQEGNGAVRRPCRATLTVELTSDCLRNECGEGYRYHHSRGFHILAIGGTAAQLRMIKHFC